MRSLLTPFSCLVTSIPEMVDLAEGGEVRWDSDGADGSRSREVSSSFPGRSGEYTFAVSVLVADAQTLHVHDYLGDRYANRLFDGEFDVLGDVSPNFRHPGT